MSWPETEACDPNGLYSNSNSISGLLECVSTYLFLFAIGPF